MHPKPLFILLGLGLVCGAGRLRGQPSAPASVSAAAPNATWTLTPAVVSQYMFRGVRLGGPAFEPAAEMDAGNLALGAWANFPLPDKVPGQSDPELDLYGAYTFPLNPAASLAPGFTWYNFPRAEKSAGFYRMTFEPSLAFNYTVKGVRLTPKFYYDLVLRGPTYELTASAALPLKNAGTELDFIATLGTFELKDALEDTNPSVKNWGNYWLLGVSAPFQLTAHSKLTAGFAYTRGSGNYFKPGTLPKFENPGAVGRGVVTLGYGFTF